MCSSTSCDSALLAGDVDFAVHSLKDLPTAARRRRRAGRGATPGDPRDALVARDGLTLAELPPESRIGTGSPRRAAQLRALGYGLDVVPIRGNVDTRIAQGRRRVSSTRSSSPPPGCDRLGRRDAATEVLDPGQMLPAPAQGALAVECRAADDRRSSPRSPRRSTTPTTPAAVAAERALLADLEAGCTAPVGALADVAMGDDGDDEIYLRAVVADLDGSRTIRLSITGAAQRTRGRRQSPGRRPARCRCSRPDRQNPRSTAARSEIT